MFIAQKHKCKFIFLLVLSVILNELSFFFVFVLICFIWLV